MEVICHYPCDKFRTQPFKITFSCHNDIHYLTSSFTKMMKIMFKIYSDSDLDSKDIYLLLIIK